MSKPNNFARKDHSKPRANRRVVFTKELWQKWMADRYEPDEVKEEQTARLAAGIKEFRDALK